MKCRAGGKLYALIFRKFVHNRVLLQANWKNYMSTNYIDELNESQRAAVLYNEGPSLVIAGAGSGKTRVLTYKIAYLLEQGFQPYSILALTFTNKAAEEMKARIARQVGWQAARYLWMGTFHSIFSRILRAEAQAIGFTSNFTIYDQADSRSLIKSIIGEMGLDKSEETDGRADRYGRTAKNNNKTAYKPALIQSRISSAKNQLILPNAYAADAETYKADTAARIPATRDIYRRYVERCRQADAMDFDDLLVYTYLLFKNHPEICRKYAERFQFVLVDEYQDTNYAQHSIIWLLTQEHQRVCVVGDDAQSIYSFRGAKIENILKFTQQYKGAKLFKLEQNYRSTRMIVQAANSLIEKNQEQIRKEIFSEKETGEPITLFNAYSDVEEGEIVVNKIRELHRRKDYAYSDFAILYRTNAQSRIFEEALRKHSLPYRIYGGLSFYQRKEIKDVIAYFRLAINSNDEEAFKRVINYPARGIGDTTVAKIVGAATQAHVSLWDVLCAPMEYNLSINKGTHAKLQAFRELIEEFRTGISEKDAYEMGQEIISRSGIMNDIYQDRTPENLSRQENVQELINGMHDFCASRQEEGDTHISLSDFLSEVSLLSDQDMDKSADAEKVTLMTIHSAKGLEFKVVFVVGMEEELFPNAMAQNSPRELEEERRLFYVAITRAEEYCFLSFARSRFRYGKVEFGNPSRFLRDIDTHYLLLPQETTFARKADEGVSRFHSSRREEEAFSYRNRPVEKPKMDEYKPAVPRNMTKIPSSSPRSASGGGAPASVQAGQMIEHERFGIGEVLRVEGTGDNCKATVRFQHAGEKQLLLKFARFKVIG